MSERQEAQDKLRAVGDVLRIGGHIGPYGPVTYPDFLADAVTEALKILDVRPMPYAPSLDALYRSTKASLASAHDRLANTEREMSSTIASLRARIADLEDDAKLGRAVREAVGILDAAECDRVADRLFAGRPYESDRKGLGGLMRAIAAARRAEGGADACLARLDAAKGGADV